MNDTITSYKEYDTEDNDALNYFIEGAKYEQQGYHTDAIVEYLEALRLDTNAAIYYALAKNYSKIYKYDRAEEYFKLAISTDSSLFTALYELGQLYLKTYNRKEAENAFEELVRIKPEPKYLYNLAYLYEFNQPEKAAEIYEALREQNEDYLLMVKLSGLYLEMSDTVKHIDRLEKAYGYAKDNPETALQLLSSYLMNKDYTKAASLLKEADYRFITEDLEYLYQDIGSELMQIVDTNANLFKIQYISLIDSRFYFNWQIQSIAGFVALQLEDTLKSESFFKRALASADSIPEIALQLANFYLIANKAESSFLLLDKYKTKFPDDYRFPNLMGLCYFIILDYDNSRIRFKKSIDIYSENIDACIQL